MQIRHLAKVKNPVRPLPPETKSNTNQQKSTEKLKVNGKQPPKKRNINHLLKAFNHLLKALENQSLQFESQSAM
jgi:hypothetical protein